MGTEFDTSFGLRECSSPRLAAASPPARDRPGLAHRHHWPAARRATGRHRDGPPRQPRARRPRAVNPTAAAPIVRRSSAARRGVDGPSIRPIRARRLPRHRARRSPGSGRRSPPLASRPSADRVQSGPATCPRQVFDRTTAVRGRSTPISALGGVEVSPVPDNLSGSLGARGGALGVTSAASGRIPAAAATTPGASILDAGPLGGPAGPLGVGRCRVGASYSR